MAMKTSAVPAQVLQLKVTLLGAMPPISRRLLASADLTLAQMHEVLQASMGGRTATGTNPALATAFREAQSEDRLMEMPPVDNERTVRLARVLGRSLPRLSYV